MESKRKRYLTTKSDADKACVSLTPEQLDRVVERFESLCLEYHDTYQYVFVKNLLLDLKRIQEYDSEPHEIWMVYQVLEEFRFFVDGVDYDLDAQLYDSVREYEHLQRAV